MRPKSQAPFVAYRKNVGDNENAADWIKSSDRTRSISSLVSERAIFGMIVVMTPPTPLPCKAGAEMFKFHSYLTWNWTKNILPNLLVTEPFIQQLLEFVDHFQIHIKSLGAADIFLSVGLGPYFVAHAFIFGSFTYS